MPIKTHSIGGFLRPPFVAGPSYVLNCVSNILMKLSQTAPVRVTPITSAFSAVARGMRSEYTRNMWQKLAAWNPQFEAPIPYPLCKYKDTLATCAGVFEKKG